MCFWIISALVIFIYASVPLRDPLCIRRSKLGVISLLGTS